MQNKESKFNWKLPLYGAIGFAIGFAIGIPIIYVGGNAINDIFIIVVLIAMVGTTMGALGGAALGLALLKDKKKVLYLSCASAIGFVIGGITGFATIGVIIFFVGFEYQFCGGCVRGAIVLILWGAIVGAVLGLALLKDKKKVLYLSCAGAISFIIGILIGFIGGKIINNILDVLMFPICDAIKWITEMAIGVGIVDAICQDITIYVISIAIVPAIWGAIVGIALGLTLAYLTKDEENKNEKPTHKQLN